MTAAAENPLGRDREPALAAAIAEAVAAYRIRKVPLGVLLAAAAAVDRTAAAAVGWRVRVAAALEDLRDSGRLAWPVTVFDRSSEPPLPVYVTRPAALTSAKSSARPTVWSHRLGWAADSTSGLSARELALLGKVNEWLARSAAGPVVPLRERSLDVFGDEKLLETLLLGPLFDSDRLDLDMLKAESCWPEVVQTVVGSADGAGTWLIVENYTTYVSVSRAAAACGFPDRIIWGSGNQVGTRLAALALAGERPIRAWYFGDVDAGGFRAARSAVIRAAELNLGTLAPASGLYRMALELGSVVPSRSAPAGVRLAEWIVDWLGGDLGKAAAAIAGRASRLVQEHVGTVALLGVDLRALLI